MDGILKEARELSSAFAEVGVDVLPDRIYALWAGVPMTEREQSDIEFAFIADAACRQRKLDKLRRRTRLVMTTLNSVAALITLALIMYWVVNGRTSAALVLAIGMAAYSFTAMTMGRRIAPWRRGR